MDTMSTQKETAEFILEKLDDRKTFALRAMFGEYALYCKGKVVALICDDTLYVKILPQSESLRDSCEQGEPYPGARPHYVVTEDMLHDSARIRDTLIEIVDALPAKKPKKKRVTKQSASQKKK